MILQTQPNRWSCLPTSAAIVFDTTVDHICQLIGHDGSEILWPKLKDPYKRRAFHFEEIQYAAIEIGWALSHHVPGILYQPNPDEAIHRIEFDEKFQALLNRCDGILIGKYRYKGATHHAVAWNAKEQVLYDPSGRLANVKSFEPEAFLAAIRI